MFGKQRMMDLMKRHHQSAEDLSEHLKSAMFQWVGNAPLRDDVTFVVTKVTI
jgi:serine phosphatase RsbU (regulator of sigma subunit)